ncbi:hypothetical protein [Methylobacterium komagatae]
MTWEIPTQEIEPLARFLREAVRLHLFPGEPGPIPFIPAIEGEDRQASLQAALPDGTPVRVSLATTPAARTRFGPRACASLRVTGVLAAGDRGHRVVAEVLIDLSTRTILRYSARLTEVGRISA